MNIVVCIKQIIDPEIPAEQFKLDPVSKRQVRGGLSLVISAYDQNALEVALQLREKAGGKITALSLGDPEAQGAVKCAMGMGMDAGVLVSDPALAPEMIRRAKARHPNLEFIQADAHDLSGLHETFDAIILSDLINDLWDVQRVFQEIKRLCTPRTRIMLNFYSRLWQFPLGMAQALGLATPNLYQNWLTREDIRGLMRLAGFEPVQITQEILFPLPLGGLANKVLVRLWPLHHLALSNFVIARPGPERATEPVVSVIVPARNESGNIKAIFERTPKMGRETELVFVEGHSKDDTFAAIQREAAAHPSTPSLILQQSGVGKADAVSCSRRYGLRASIPRKKDYFAREVNPGKR